MIWRIIVAEAKLAMCLIALWLLWRWALKKDSDEEFAKSHPAVEKPKQVFRRSFPAGTVQNPSDPSPQPRAPKTRQNSEK